MQRDSNGALRRWLPPFLAVFTFFAIYEWVQPDGRPANTGDSSGGQSHLDLVGARTASALPILGGRSGDPSVPDIAERAVRSVVNISSTKVQKSGLGNRKSPLFSDPFFRHFFGPRSFQQMPRERREKALGSGVIVNTNGIVLTNNHVVEDADEIRVSVASGDSEDEYEAELVGSDPKSDLAVLRLEGDVGKLEALPLGDSSSLRLGESVLAIGNPFGLTHTVTLGIVSAKGRANVGIVDYEDFIQTDAAINPGNSGGALVNMKGELVGINTAILSRSGGYQGIGFAIPSDMARSVMDSLLEHGRVVRGWLGVMIQNLDKDLAGALDLGDAKGVLISQVQKDSPAEKAGLKRGDVVLSVNGDRVGTVGRLRNLVAMLGAKAKARVKVLRDGEERTIDVILGELPADGGAAGKVDESDETLGGLSLGDLTPGNRRKFELPDSLDSGVVVVEVEPGSPAQMARLKPGDVLMELNRRAIASVQDFRERYDAARGTVLLLVRRGEGTLYLVLEKKG